MQIEHRQYGLIDVRAAGDTAGSFSGYGAIFGNVDSYNETIENGAFKRDLSQWKSKGKLPKMLLQHGGLGLTSDDMLPVGKWTSMEEDRKGLKVEGRLLAMNTERGQYIYEGLKSGELDSLSIGFQAMSAREELRDGEPIKVLTEIKLWEVSIVTFPANDKAKISSVKKLTLDEVREIESHLREGGLSRRDCEIAISILKKYPLRDAGEPNSVLREEAAPDEMDDLIVRLARHTDANLASAIGI